MRSSVGKSFVGKLFAVFRAPLALVLAIALVSSIASCAATKDATEDPSAAFLRLAEAHASRILQTAPEWASQLGVAESIGGRDFNSRLSNYGVSANADLRELSATLNAELSAVNPKVLTGTARVTYDILHYAYELAERQNAEALGNASLLWVNPPYAADQLFGIHTGLPRLLIAQHLINDRSSAAAYLARLAQLDDALIQVLELLAHDQSAGVLPPTFALRAMSQSAATFIAGNPEEHVLVTSFASRLADQDFYSLAEQDAALQRARTLVANEVYPAYQRFADAMDKYLSVASDDAGLWRFDNGELLYQIALENYGANGLRPAEIHQLGLDDVRRIESQMDKNLQSLGYSEGSVADRMLVLAQDPEHRYPSTDAGRAEILADLRAYVDAVYAVTDEYFVAIPPQKIEVRRVPEYEEDAAGGAYYTGPSLDGTQPGVFWINLKEPADWPRYSLATLVYHEAVPGHHFQTSSQLQINDMPLIRNMMFFADYAEGWALYAEALAVEMGLYKNDPLGDLGRLKMELYRAARLVVDTGLHDKRWTREQAIDWMVATTGEPEDSIRREIERYAVWPGQATAYKLGMIGFQQIRQDAERELGERFDLGRFHQALLSEGTMPMAVLGQRMRSWINAQ